MSIGTILEFVTCQSSSVLHKDSASVALRWDPEINILTGLTGESEAHNPWITPKSTTGMLL